MSKQKEYKKPEKDIKVEDKPRFKSTLVSIVKTKVKPKSKDK